MAGNGARWKRGDDEKNENKKPNEGTKVVPMTGEPEDTEETGQQPADGRNKETATPVPAKIQQHEQYEHHRLIDPGSNGGDCGFRAFAIAFGTAEQQNSDRKHGPKQTAEERSHAQTQGTRQFQIANSLEAVLGTRHQSHHHHGGWSIPNSADTLRHKAHASFKSQTAWKQFWARDTKATITTEGGASRTAQAGGLSH